MKRDSNAAARPLWLATGLALLLAFWIGPALAQAGILLERPSAEDIAARIAQADQYPLGSADNPVRTPRMFGQQDYLSRLRCGDGTSPSWERRGSIGLGPFGTIVDRYALICGDDPEPKFLHLDMYHNNHVERRAPDGFDIVN